MEENKELAVVPSENRDIKTGNIIKYLLVGSLIFALLIIIGFQFKTIRGLHYEIISLRNEIISNQHACDSLRIQLINPTSNPVEKLVKEEEDLLGNSIMGVEYLKSINDSFVNMLDSSMPSQTFGENFYETTKNSVVYDDELMISYKLEYYNMWAHGVPHFAVGTVNRHKHQAKISSFLSRQQKIHFVSRLSMVRLKRESSFSTKWRSVNDMSGKLGPSRPKDGGAILRIRAAF